jgi:hypothetical protein
VPVKSNAHSILFDPRDVHLALRRLEREACPPDRIEVARVRTSEARNGHLRVRKVKVTPPSIGEIELNWEAVKL